jgi:serine/threonine protein kinase
MGAMKHKHVVQIEGYGDDGVVIKQSGRMIKNIVYILMEYICGGILFDVCQTHGRLGEDIGRYFFNQILDVMEYMQNQGVVHRDLKLENILIDDNLDLNIADFGFATYKNI